MIYEQKDGTYYASCMHDPDRICCLICQEQAAKTFIYHNIPRAKWPVWMHNKFQDITKEQIAKEIENYEKSPERTNTLLERILNKLNNYF